MNRRTLFGKFAAVAAAAALAPAVQAEARAEPMKVVWETYDEGADLDAGRRELLKQLGDARASEWHDMGEVQIGEPITYLRTAEAFSYSTGAGMRAIPLPDRQKRSRSDLRLMCWDCKWTSPWVFEGTSITNMFAPFETHLAAVHPGEAIDHEMQWRPSQWATSIEEDALSDALSDARAEGYRAGWETRRLSDESHQGQGPDGLLEITLDGRRHHVPYWN